MYARKLWERFLEICSKNKSLVGYTWKELRSNLEAIELKNIYGLNPMAKEFIPRGKVSVSQSGWIKFDLISSVHILSFNVRMKCGDNRENSKNRF